MPTHDSVKLPQGLMHRAKRLARKRNLPLGDLFELALTLAEEETNEVEMDQVENRKMALEEAAFRKLHPQLVKTHFGQFVAIHNQALVDADLNEKALVERIDRKFPTQIVCIKRVTENSEKILHIRTPLIS